MDALLVFSFERFFCTRGAVPHFHGTEIEAGGEHETQPFSQHEFGGLRISCRNWLNLPLVRTNLFLALFPRQDLLWFELECSRVYEPGRPCEKKWRSFSL